MYAIKEEGRLLPNPAPKKYVFGRTDVMENLSAQRRWVKLLVLVFSMVWVSNSPIKLVSGLLLSEFLLWKDEISASSFWKKINTLAKKTKTIINLFMIEKLILLHLIKR